MGGSTLERGTLTLLGYCCFFWNFIVLLYFPLISRLLDLLSGPWFFGIYVIMPLFFFFPALVGPLVFSTWGDRFQRLRIFISHVLFACAFIIGWLIPFQGEQWLWLTVLFACQLIATGIAVLEMAVWNCIVFIGLLITLSISPSQNVLFLVHLVIALYLLCSAIMVITKTWETGPYEE